MNYDRARVYRLFQQTLASIAEAFKAEKQVLVEGKWVTRADHSTSQGLFFKIGGGKVQATASSP